MDMLFILYYKIFACCLQYIFIFIHNFITQHSENHIFTKTQKRLHDSHISNNPSFSAMLFYFNFPLLDSRCIFILGTMFRLDSRMAGEILDMTPKAYRQKLSRIRKKMADFLGTYCGEYGSGRCRCRDRINYAISSHRLDPLRLDYTSAGEIPLDTMLDVKCVMEEIDDLSQDFSFCRPYRAPERTRSLIREFLDSTQLSVVKNASAV